MQRSPNWGRQDVAELHRAESQAFDPAPQKLWVAAAFAIGGMALLIAGADQLVQGAVTLARGAGLSETVIGLTIVSLGTSLPELVATLAAAAKGRSDVAFGNIVGSRDAPREATGLGGRLVRAHRNLLEIFPQFAAALFVVHAAHAADSLTHIGAWTFVVARFLYVPAYASAPPGVRPVCWTVAQAGIFTILADLFW